MPPGANFMPPPMGAPDMPAPPMMGGPPGMYFLWKNFFLLQNNRHLCKFFCGTCLKIIVIKTWKCELKIYRWKKKRKKSQIYLVYFIAKQQYFWWANLIHSWKKINFFYIIFIRFPASSWKYSTPSLPSPRGYATYGDASSLSNPRRQ